MYIINETDNTTEILLYALILDGITARQLIDQLNASSSENITLRINSDGGDVFEAIAIYNYLKSRNVTVMIDGVCASGASIIAMAGKKIIMNRGSMMMIHQPMTYCAGDADTLREQADILDKITDSIAGIYAERTGKSKSEIAKLMASETWLTADEALEAGFVDEIEAKTNAQTITNSASSGRSYEQGVENERMRLRQLDELQAPGRESILMRAKYETYENASDVAIELLNAERPSVSKHQPVLNSLSTQTTDNMMIDLMVQSMNRMRGNR